MYDNKLHSTSVTERAVPNGPLSVSVDEAIVAQLIGEGGLVTVPKTSHCLNVVNC